MLCFCAFKKASIFLWTFNFCWGAAWSWESGGGGEVEALGDGRLLVLVVISFSSSILAEALETSIMGF